MFIRTYRYRRRFPLRLLAVYAVILTGLLLAIGFRNADASTDFVDRPAIVDEA